ncbi:MAG TPA: FAD-binding oxidoreductase [Gaiellaceae bacterium]
MTRRELLARAAGLSLSAVLGGCSLGGSGKSGGTTTGTVPPPPKKPPRAPTLRELESQLRGPLLRPGSSAFSSARTIENERYASIRPHAIAVAHGEEDVARCVRFASRSALPFAVRSGGHSYAGYSMSSGLVCDVRRLDSIRIAPDGRSVTVGAGALAIDLISTLAERGLAVPTGSCPTVGISGLALGGGVGFAGRVMGATCDTIEAVRIVTADGKIVTADPRTNEDLYWACRGGGGGNFGAVTALTLRTHPVDSAAYGFCSFPWSQAAEAVAAWQGLAPHGPAELYLICALETGSAEPTVRVFGQLLGGSDGSLQALMAPVTAVAGSSLSTGSGRYLDVQRIWAGCSGESDEACRELRPSAFAAKSAYCDRPLPAAGAQAIVAAVEERQAEGSGTGAVLLDPYGGALGRPAPDATAFVHRDQLYSAQLLAYWTSADGAAAADRWLAGLARALRPYTSGQAYQNYIDPDLAGWQRAYYGENLARLREIKARYDPDEVFRFAQSIPPA